MLETKNSKITDLDKLSQSEGGVEDHINTVFKSFGALSDIEFSPQGYDNKPRVNIKETIDELPDMVNGLDNRLKSELIAYYLAVPPKRRIRGVYLDADTLLTILMERLEMLDRLQRSVVRMCKGYDCPHYVVCPFKDVVQGIELEDRIPCAVEREVVQDTVQNFAMVGPNGEKPSIDPRKAEQALLFKELIELLVKKTRIGMYMQKEDMLVDHWEIVRDGETESFQTSGNQLEHPLMLAWDKNQLQILRVMKELGLSPEFQIRHNLYVDDSLKVDAEKRAEELSREKLRELYTTMRDNLPEHDPNRLLLNEALNKFNTQED